MRLSTAPDGSPWPVGSCYVDGYGRLLTTRMDNSRNDSEVFVKQVLLDGGEAYPARHFYLPAFRHFTLEKVKASLYDIRYRDLTTVALSRSDPFSGAAASSAAR